MRICEECKNHVSLLSSYNHPILGRNHLICGQCYMKIDKIIEQWGTFIMTNPDIVSSLRFDGEDLRNNFETIVTSIMNVNEPRSHDDLLSEYSFNGMVQIV